ncbi:MAG TPA: serine hydrolase [Negativicutes bacterium]|nr:serine hydrolase [Negativicutes bacterium]
MHKSKSLILFLALSGVVFAVTVTVFDQPFPGSGAAIASVQEAASTIVITQTAIASEQPVAQQPVALPPKEVTANAAISLRADENGQEVIFEKSAHVPLPIASLTKLMAALVVMEHYNLAQKITVSEAAMGQEGDQGELKAGQIFSVKNLLYIMLMESSNRAAYALSDAMGNEEFVALMNENAALLGLANTSFDDSTGLSEKSYASARDVALLSSHLFENYPLFKEIIGTKEFDVYLEDAILHHKAITTNILFGVNRIIGGKTGYTDAARGCLMIIQENTAGGYTVHVVLGAEDRWGEMQKVLEIKN